MKINPEHLDFYREEKPRQSVYIEFVRRNPDQILDLGSFEAFRRWLLTDPKCISVESITPETSHRVAREFFKKLKKEGKIEQ